MEIARIWGRSKPQPVTPSRTKRQHWLRISVSDARTIENGIYYLAEMMLRQGEGFGARPIADRCLSILEQIGHNLRQPLPSARELLDERQARLETKNEHIESAYEVMGIERSDPTKPRIPGVQQLELFE